MRQLFPDAVADVDPERLYAHDARPARAGRPWLVVNMISSIDGATALSGRSGQLGGPADRRIFRALRAVADVILVAGGTLRAEGYGPPRLPEEIQRRRVEHGQEAQPRIAVVSASLRLDRSSALFTESDPPPLVVTAPGADRARRVELARSADVLLAGHDERVDLVAALGSLGELGARVVLCEGGPSLNAQLLADDLVDELCLSLAPLLVGGDSPRIFGTTSLPEDQGLGLELARVLEEEGLLFLRYLRA